MNHPFLGTDCGDTHGQVHPKQRDDELSRSELIVRQCHGEAYGALPQGLDQEEWGDLPFGFVNIAMKNDSFIDDL